MQYLYACNFSNGHIKVGRSSDPKSRIASHEERVSCMGVLLVESHISECVGDVVRSEAALINLCAQSAEQQYKNEWFSGLPFLFVTQWVEECAKLTHASESTFKGFFYGLGKDQRKEFALACNTSVGHLNNFCYGLTTLAPILCTSIERESKGEVTRRELRPDDCEGIWPDLLPVKSAA